MTAFRRLKIAFLTVHNGSYLDDCAVRNEAAESCALDPSDAEKLWSLSEELVGPKFQY